MEFLRKFGAGNAIALDRFHGRIIHLEPNVIPL